MNTILEIKGLSKSFQQQSVLNNLNMSIPKGSIYGFVGKNGAGKTTTMKLILGLICADQGEITVCDTLVTFGNTNVNKHIGYLPDVPAFYDYMTAKEYLVLCGKLLYQNNKTIDQYIDELLEKVGLTNIKQTIGSYSRGMKQRLGIAQALIGKPDLLICDEPTSALDPNGRRDILSILNSIKDQTTVIFSTHILSDVQNICDYIGILDQGHIVLEGNIQELEKQTSQSKLSISFYYAKDVTTCYDLLKNQFTSSQTTKEIIYQLNDVNKDSLYIMNTLVNHKLVPSQFLLQQKTIEDIFLEVTA